MTPPIQSGPLKGLRLTNLGEILVYGLGGIAAVVFTYGALIMVVALADVLR